MKRVFDLLLAVPLLVLAAPLLAFIALFILIRSGRPVLFRQVRPGYGGRLFKVNKFRTMEMVMDAEGNPLPDEDRLPSWGKWLRSTSLDELPELLNVVSGEMSLVGPRPLLSRYLERYTPEQARRHEVAPGMAGWAQVNGRNALSWEEKFRLDVWYVDHWSLGLDLKILAMTVGQVLRREGINQPGQATAEEFWGNQENP